jgi:hypothetical protein
MSKAENVTKVVLFGGPCAGQYAVAEIQQFQSHGSYRFPFDEHFLLTDKAPFALAIYGVADVPAGGGIKLYWFQKFVRVDNGPFMVELVGGPLAGVRPMHQPVLGLPGIVDIPLKSEPADGQEGRWRVYATYKNGAQLGGDHKMIFDSERRDLTTDQRIIFELTGGPYDGVTYDTDAGALEQESHFRASSFYFITDQGAAGKRFMGIAPYAKQAIEEFGHEAVTKYAVPFQSHMYEVTGKVEAPYEVYVQAKYVGLAKDDS